MVFSLTPNVSVYSIPFTLNFFKLHIISNIDKGFYINYKFEFEAKRFFTYIGMLNRTPIAVVIGVNIQKMVFIYYKRFELRSL